LTHLIVGPYPLISLLPFPLIVVVVYLLLIAPRYGDPLFVVKQRNVEPPFSFSVDGAIRVGGMDHCPTFSHVYFFYLPPRYFTLPDGIPFGVSRSVTLPVCFGACCPPPVSRMPLIVVFFLSFLKLRCPTSFRAVRASGARPLVPFPLSPLHSPFYFSFF